MSAQHKTLMSFAVKIGLGDEPKVCRKALEYLRLVESKATNGIVLSDNSKYVLCLELAAGTLAVPIDTVSAVKFSGLKKAIYLSSKKMFEKILGLNEELTLKTVCLKNECSSVISLAENILRKMKECCSQEIDCSLSQYICMAVYQACRISKVKISKNKLLEMSRLKPLQWNKLCTDWTAIVDTHFSNSNKNVKLPNQDDAYIDTDSNSKTEEKVPLEDFDIWKARILKEAYLELASIKDMNKQRNPLADSNTSPKKSPKKSAIRHTNKLNSVTQSPKWTGNNYTDSCDTEMKEKATVRQSPRKLVLNIIDCKERLASDAIASPKKLKCQSPKKSDMIFSPKRLSIRVAPKKSLAQRDEELSDVKRSPKLKLMF